MSGAWLRLLAAAEQGGRRQLTRILQRMGGPEPLLRRAGGGGLDLAPEVVRALGQDHARTIERWRRWLDEPTHHLITLSSASYPSRLRELPDPPLALWVEGPDLRWLELPQLAIVGSRQPTAGGRQLASELARELAAVGMTVTSGLAAGIDAAAHGGALDGPGGTIAVLGCGIDRVYPRRNAALARRVVERGLMVSEHGPGVPPRPFQFPQRNRIIAGLALGTLVVEATTNSGSLITAGLAADYGREVFAIPGSVHSPLSRGCHGLLREGAILVETIADILPEIGLQIDAAALPTGSLTSTESARPGTPEPAPWLDFSPASLDELAARSGLTAAELSSMLLHLEMQGTVEALPGGRYCRLVKRH